LENVERNAGRTEAREEKKANQTTTADEELWKPDCT